MLAIYIAAFAAGASAQTTNIFPLSGNVGIGTTSPVSQLHVFGSGNQVLTLQSTTVGFPGISFANTVGGYTNQLDGVTGSLYWFNGSTRNMTLLQNGYLGIGTTNPSNALSVVGTGGTANNGPAVSLITATGNAGGGGYIWGQQFLAPNALVGDYVLGMLAGVSNANYNAGYMSFHYLGSGSLNNTLSFGFYGGGEKMEINGNGNVGIGTTSPSAKLEVNGGLRFTSDPGGTVQTTAWTGVLCGGDYAEAVDVAGDLRRYGPGDVLVIASDKDDDVEKASEPYSTKVVGIYATKPGVIGRRQSLGDSPDAVPMAMVGIVPAKVSAENGPVHKGDLLVTASIPGYAMKGTDRSRMLGAVIGKALGNLDSGTGVIEAVVTLQ